MTPEQLKSRLKIDKSALDEEVSQQPMMLQDVADAYEEAAAVRDALKEELATIDAELYQEFKREDGGTEAMIKSLVQTDTRHEKAFNRWLDAKTKAAKLGAMREAFQSRSYMLRDLASLYISGYYESTSIQGTHATDTAVYLERRKAMAAGRAAKG